MKKIKKGDQIVVISGKDKGKRGTVISYGGENKLLVEGVNLVHKHQKPNPNRSVEAGIVKKIMPIHSSNVALYNPTTGKGERIGFRLLADGRKVRYFKITNEIADF